MKRIKMSKSVEEWAFISDDGKFVVSKSADYPYTHVRAVDAPTGFCCECGQVAAAEKFVAMCDKMVKFWQDIKPHAENLVEELRKTKIKDLLKKEQSE